MEFQWRLALHRCSAVEQYPKTDYNDENKPLSKNIALFLWTKFFDLCPGTETNLLNEIMHFHNMVQDLHGHILTPEHLPCGHGIYYCCGRHRKHRIDILMFCFCPVHCDVECLTERWTTWCIFSILSVKVPRSKTQWIFFEQQNSKKSNATVKMFI